MKINSNMSEEILSKSLSLVPPQAHLVAAFEQSLGNMTIRLKSLTLTAEQKVRADSPLIFCLCAFRRCILTCGPPTPLPSLQDSELNELRKTIELLKKQNAVAQAAINGVINTPELAPKGDRTGEGGALRGAANTAALATQKHDKQ